MKPLEPSHAAHYIAACKIAEVPVADTRLSTLELRALIEKLSTMAIPDAARYLRSTRGEEAGRCGP